MERRYTWATGKPLNIDREVVINADSHLDTLTVSVRSLSGVDADTIKRLLQRNLVVLSVSHDSRTTVVREVRNAG